MLDRDIRFILKFIDLLTYNQIRYFLSSWFVFDEEGEVRKMNKRELKAKSPLCYPKSLRSIWKIVWFIYEKKCIVIIMDKMYA